MKWREFKLGNIVSIKHGYAFKGAFFVDTPTKNILLTPGNFNIGGGFKKDKLKYYLGEIPQDYILSEGDVIVTMTDLSKKADTLGFSARIPKDNSKTFLHNQRIGLVQLIDDSFDIGFMHWLMRSVHYQQFVAGSATGATVKHTSPSKIYAFKFKAPTDKNEQQKIAHILSAYDDLIENNLKRIKLLEEIAQITYEEWFVRMKFPGYEPAVIDPETCLPEGWVRKTLNKGVNVNPTTKVSKKDLAPFVPMGALSVNSMVIFGVEERKPSGGAKFINGDTLVARITPCLENGKTGYVDFLSDGQIATGSTEFIVLRETELVNRFYIYCMSRSEYFRELSIRSMAGSDGRQRVNPKIYGKMLLSIPTKDIMDSFEKRMKPVFNSIKTLVQENQCLKEARDILLPRLMTGMIDVNTLDLPKQIEREKEVA